MMYFNMSTPPDLLLRRRVVSAGGMKWWRKVEVWRGSEQKSRKAEEGEVVQMLLRGNAPWGFTLRGGTEHRGPLVTTKVERGSVAAADEQEAVRLVRSRSALSLLVRRKNDPNSRPHSWHASKLTEEESEAAVRDAAAARVWQPKHDARPNETPSRGDQSSQCPLTSQLSPGTNMEKLERPSHPLPSQCSAQPLCGPEGKRDSAFSCFSIASSPPGHDHRASDRKGTSTENIFFKGLYGEGPRPAERPRYPCEGSRGEEQPASRCSFAGRSGVGLQGKVPEKKKSQSPPPQPPLRSDSFAASKVFPYPEGPSGQAKTRSMAAEKLPESSLASRKEKPSEARRSLNRLPTKDFLHPNAADHNQTRLPPSRLFSLSSNDVRQPHHSQLAGHQRQHSDESPFCKQTRPAPATKVQSVGSYYRSLQDLPANIFSRKHVRHSTASVASSAANQENGRHNRYHGLASKHSVQTTELQVRRGEAEGRRGEMEEPPRVDPNEPSSSNTNGKVKYIPPQFKERGGHSLHRDVQTSEHPVQSSEDAAKRGEAHASDARRRLAAHPSTDYTAGLSRHQDPWVLQEDHRISRLKTPLLHSLAQESRSLATRAPAASTASLQEGDAAAAGSFKSNRRSDRYATTLRNEIQRKRAQLQKSRSAATLTYDVEDDEAEAEEWKSTRTAVSSGVSSSNTYKDHLKEAQARVLQATSFQRRDLEPLEPEALAVKTTNGRFRGRKRFPLAKKTLSFSEPDKMDKVGVEGEPHAGSFGERKKFFEAKPAFSRPVLKSSPGATPNADLSEVGKPKDRVPCAGGEVHPSALRLRPGHEQVLEQQRLGSFAEYQATWSQQKKSAEAQKQGRFHSAENILDAEGEEKAACIHERSRSSPSADLYTQNNPSSWKDPHSQQSSHRGKAERTLRFQSDLSPQSAPRDRGPVPGLPDHRTKADAARPPDTTRSSAQNPPPPPQAQGLLPPPRPHLGPETTSSSREFLAGARADPTAPQPPSGCDRHHAAGPASGRLPSSTSGGGGGNEAEKQPLSSCTAARSLPATDRARSPSPQRDDSPLGSEKDVKLPAEMEPMSPGRKAPVSGIHSESGCRGEGRACLPRSGETCVPVQAPPPDARTCQDPVQASATVQGEGPPGDRGSEEDAKREELARDIIRKDKSLVDILDQSGRMTTMDLMEGLFPTEEQVLEGAHLRRRASSGSRLPTSPPRSRDREEEDLSASASLVPSSSYYNTSAPKAELLIKMKDMQEQLEEQDSEDEPDVNLASKKQELISSLARKLEVLREARRSLQEDVEDNEALGREVEATVRRLCRANQLDKFCMFVGDLDKVVSLLLSLSGRLARVENALNGLEDEAPPEEKRTLTEKRKMLMQQHEDAKELKENLDRRERLVSGVMEAHLEAGSLDDYRHFVKMKSALIIEQRKLEDKIKLGEEQLKGLVDSLPPETRPWV
ncbi:protein Shroom2-like isoform X2 [Gasterosteus aculeatus]